MRIFCFPFAGGGANSYISWPQWLPNNIELVLIEPPGRGARISEPCCEDMQEWINELLLHKEEITRLPYVFFGHSLGAHVAFELCCQLKQYQCRLPLRFIASGSEAPHLISHKKQIHTLPRNEFIHELKQLNGTPGELLDNAEMMNLMLPILRADFKIAETYTASPTTMPFPISVFHGLDDIEISLAQREAWQHLSQQQCNIHEFKGDHFFILEFKDTVLLELNSILKEALCQVDAIYSPSIRPTSKRNEMVI
ncbi:thioesterase [Pseudoalteromonas luteoviolacea]|nr:thioesterase domain-containing protein [Pseudoalteromonas luteoviolacea]MBQ4814042.1 thioesterase [Pseudoalteromonas luteoviolacea]